jgi:nucleoid-associated protein YgaU
VGREVVVRPGDTLWGIAAELGIEGDLRDAVARLAEFNGGAVIRPGEVVEVPADLLAG